MMPNGSKPDLRDIYDRLTISEKDIVALEVHVEEIQKDVREVKKMGEATNALAIQLSTQVNTVSKMVGFGLTAVGVLTTVLWYYNGIIG